MKYTKIALTVCSVSAAFFLSACGGGSSSGMSGDATGTFIDAPVENLKYSCDPSGVSGVTDRDGKFSCKYGDDVSFHIGKMTIGSMEFVEDMVVTPYKLYPTNSTAAVRLAQLLQSLDDDGDIGSRITVEKKYAEAITEVLDPTENSFTNEAQALLDEVDVTLVDANSAKKHLAAQDTSSPMVTLMGDAQVTIIVGEVYMDAGATAYDEFDGKMDPVKSGSVDTSKAGTYTITYKATDQAGNTGSISRKVMVVASNTPTPTPSPTPEPTPTPTPTATPEPTPTPTTKEELEASEMGDSCIAENGETGKVEKLQDPFGNPIPGTATCEVAGGVEEPTPTPTPTPTATPEPTPTPTTKEELEASKMGDSCIAENGESGEVAKLQDPFGNPIPGTATCEVAGGVEEPTPTPTPTPTATPEPTPTPTTKEELEASKMGDSCIAENGESGEVAKLQDPFGNPIPGTATCEVAGGVEEPTPTPTPTPTATPEPTPTTKEELEASEMGDSCIAENGETGKVEKLQDPFGNPIPGTATCEVAL
ncbi:MAG: DUF5011 domain-containing protein [Sulfurovum sp.]|nr:DUF5011 domain-containing protein [Sulfurovum sp.]